MKTLIVCEQDGTVVTEGYFNGPDSECQFFIEHIKRDVFPDKLFKILDDGDNQMELPLLT